MTVGQGWTPICRTCWGLAESSTFPVENGYTECGSCGVVDLTVNAHPEVVRAAVATRRPCYCIRLFTDHLVGAEGCQFNADWTDRG